jgi:hypothetical protein
MYKKELNKESSPYPIPFLNVYDLRESLIVNEYMSER